MKWYRKSAELGDAVSQWRLGLLYNEGKGVGRDDSEAAKWYKKAADQEDLTAKEAFQALQKK